MLPPRGAGVGAGHAGLRAYDPRVLRLTAVGHARRGWARWLWVTTEWYEAVSTWKEFSLGAMEGEEEEKVLVPAACSPCLVGLLTELCRLIDRVALISRDVVLKERCDD